MRTDPVGRFRLALIAVLFVAFVCGAGIYAAGQGEHAVQQIATWLGM